MTDANASSVCIIIFDSTDAPSEEQTLCFWLSLHFGLWIRRDDDMRRLAAGRAYILACPAHTVQYLLTVLTVGTTCTYIGTILYVGT